MTKRTISRLPRPFRLSRYLNVFYLIGPRLIVMYSLQLVWIAHPQVLNRLSAVALTSTLSFAMYALRAGSLRMLISHECLPQTFNRDSSLRFQYFASNQGALRVFPGRQWPTDSAGNTVDFDGRLQTWYGRLSLPLSLHCDRASMRCCRMDLSFDIRHRPFLTFSSNGRYTVPASGAKDIVVLLDASASMARGARFANAVTAVKALLQTLSPSDFVNVIAVRACLTSFFIWVRESECAH